ncbi:lysophospholipid acyltransferase family protein [Cocleimonas flava]|uniref:KDO2-lipid IV(A) lauroyltransferase/lauroyl-KDO2-lipid IV(A) myristoyltransferase n=1 Tax=Cocleimonas flava TaxID=634765 RepID=A0A4R1FEK3_9GAMM|nr:lysophospholipid acyltransferase family protein [Cocleimonas flava]TCJ89311.1 KDO2-lipid IV(A) lauroyltransferase/lauroyl-KDO2-lipid IV(A) myristoyltransferase [Cocleimonas flava]
MSQQCGIKFTASLMHPKYWLTWVGLGIFYLISYMPASVRHMVGRRIGSFMYRSPRRRNTVISNLEIAFPELSSEALEDLAQKNMEWYGCGLIDYSLIIFTSRKRLSKFIEIEGKEHIEQAVQNQQNVIILLAHSVMLEFAPTAIGAEYDIFGSYKTSKNPVMDWIIAKSRCRHASLVVSRDEGLRKLVKSMSPGRLMVFLPDEDLGLDNSVFVPFFSRQKSTLTTTARLAKMGKAVALTTFAYYDKDKRKYIAKISKPLENYPSKDAAADAQNMNQALEAIIRQHPEQYMWSMKWYKTRPEGEAKVY